MLNNVVYVLTTTRRYFLLLIGVAVCYIEWMHAIVRSEVINL